MRQHGESILGEGSRDNLKGWESLLQENKWVKRRLSPFGSKTSCSSDRWLYEATRKLAPVDAVRVLLLKGLEEVDTAQRAAKNRAWGKGPSRETGCTTVRHKVAL